MKSFWQATLDSISLYEYDFALAALYSLNGDCDLDGYSELPGSTISNQFCLLEGTVGVPEGHPSVPHRFDLDDSDEGIVAYFREAIRSERPILLQKDDGTLSKLLFHGIECRGFEDPCSATVIFPIRPSNEEQVMGFLLIGGC